MTIEQFIEKAIEGGWMRHVVDPERGIGKGWSFEGEYFRIQENGHIYVRKCIAEIVLDIRAWQAVGKVEGWVDSDQTYVQGEPKNWRIYMHRMVDVLADGKTIEEVLKTI